jgi:predicted GNAT family acetyltransferase
VLDYTEADGSLRLTHTYVPGEFEGQGIGSALVRAAMEHARREGLTVVPVCPFVKVFVDRNPEYADLLSR